jgi:hypothetical protein
MGKIASLQTFDGVSKNFMSDGLFSTEIFGRVGEEKRNRTFAYIDLRIPVFHPIIYRALVDLKKIHAGIISGDTYATWDDKNKEFVKSDQIDGFTGFNYFISKLDQFDLTIKDEHTNKRKNTLKLLAKYKKQYFMDKLLVLPAGLRDYEIDSDGKPSEGEVNSYYRRIMSLANNIVPSAIKTNPESLDMTRSSLQDSILELYDYFESLLKGKNKLMLGKWASRKVFNSTRNVLSVYTPRSSKLTEIGITTNHAVYGLYQYLKATLPIYEIKTGFISLVFPAQNYPMTVTDAKTWKKKVVPFDHASYDKWMTNEGIEKIIGQFGNDAYKTDIAKVGDDYIGLVYSDNVKFQFFQDIDELPEGWDKTKVRPINYAELFYHSVYRTAYQTPVTITRYPITGIGSIYPAYTYLLTTMKGLRLTEYKNGEPTQDVALEFPNGDEFFSSVSVSAEHLGPLSADMDGDTVSVIALQSVEARAEIAKLLDSREYYIEDNKFIYSSDTGIIRQVMSYMTDFS